MDDLEASGFEHFLGGFLHVLGHLVLVVAKFIVEAQGGYAPLVFHNGIEIYIVFVAGQDLAERAHADVRALVLANFFFEGRAETMHVGAAGKHGAAAAAFESIATDEIGAFLGEIAKSRDVKAAWAAVVERRRLADEVLCAACDSGPHDVFAEIVADMTAGVGYAVWIEARFGK